MNEFKNIQKKKPFSFQGLKKHSNYIKNGNVEYYKNGIRPEPNFVNSSSKY